MHIPSIQVLLKGRRIFATALRCWLREPTQFALLHVAEVLSLIAVGLGLEINALDIRQPMGIVVVFFDTKLIHRSVVEGAVVRL